MKTKSLPHNFTTAFGVIDMAGIVGYQKCLAHLTQYINKRQLFIRIEKSESPPGAFIDSAKLMQTIKATTLELKELMDNETSEIKAELSDLTKSINP